MKHKQLSGLVLAGTLSLASIGCSRREADIKFHAEYDGHPAVYRFWDDDGNGSYDYVRICHGCDSRGCDTCLVLKGEKLATNIYNTVERKLLDKIPLVKRND